MSSAEHTDPVAAFFDTPTGIPEPTIPIPKGCDAWSLICYAKSWDQYDLLDTEDGWTEHREWHRGGMLFLRRVRRDGHWLSESKQLHWHRVLLTVHPPTDQDRPDTKLCTACLGTGQIDWSDGHNRHGEMCRVCEGEKRLPRDLDLVGPTADVDLPTGSNGVSRDGHRDSVASADVSAAAPKPLRSVSSITGRTLSMHGTRGSRGVKQ